jgi:hypothetical protein
MQQGFALFDWRRLWECLVGLLGQDRSALMGVFTSFIRQHASWTVIAIAS